MRQTSRVRRRAWAAMAVVFATGLAACGGGGGPSDLNLPSTPTTAPQATTTVGAAAPAPPVGSPDSTLPDYVSLVAVARVPKLAVYKTPGAASPARDDREPVVREPRTIRVRRSSRCSSSTPNTPTGG